MFNRDKILSIKQAVPQSWSEYTTDKLKSEKLIKLNFHYTTDASQVQPKQNNF